MHHAEDLGWGRLVGVMAGSSQPLSHVGADTAAEIALGRARAMLVHASEAARLGGRGRRTSLTGAALDVVTSRHRLSVRKTEDHAICVSVEGVESRFERAADGAQFVRTDGSRLEAFLALAIDDLACPPLLPMTTEKG